MRAILKIIDTISVWAGETARWLCPALVLLVTLEVIRRFVFNAPSMWAFETSMMIGAIIYVFGWGYVHRYRAHVRVDVLYKRLPARGQAIIDVLGGVLLYFPYILALTYTATTEAVNAWVINEKMTETYWYPPIAPLRTMVLIGLLIFLFQAMAHFVRDVYRLIRNKNYD